MRKVPDYLFRMIDDYMSNKWVIYEGDKWFLKEEMIYVSLSRVAGRATRVECHV